MATLLEEIQSVCTSELLNSRDISLITSIVNAGRTKVVMVEIADVQAYLQSTGVWWSIKAAAANPDHPANLAAQAVMDVAGARYIHLDTTLPIMDQMLAGLVATSIITQAHKDHITSMGVVPDPVSEREVNMALVTDGGEWRI